jgi:tRNA (guanine-N7-)-methyltransferase
VVKALDGIERDDLGNVRLHANDARDLVRALPDASIERAFVLFPDPWPKARHAKRRLVNARLLASLSRVMAPGGELRIATDIAAYREEMLGSIAVTPAFTLLTRSEAEWANRPADWPPTRYEAKAVKAGRACAYLRLARS